MVRTTSVVLLVLAGLAIPGWAEASALSDRNSYVTLDTDPASTQGLMAWVVDGIVHMNSQWFWYRTEGMDGEESVNTLPLEMSLTNGDFDAGTERAVLLYTGDGFTITVDVTLTGGSDGSGRADLVESIAIENTAAAPLSFHFYQFCNPALGNTPTDDVVAILGENNTARCEDALIRCEAVVTPQPSQYAAASAGSLLAELGDGNPTDLGYVPGPYGPGGSAAWAFQWDFDLAGGDTYLVSIDKMIVPEPATLALLGLGVAGLVVRRRRK